MKTKRGVKVPKKSKLSAAAIIEKLQRELAEKDEILKAIQSGEVDALIVKTKKGHENIFPLQGSQLPYQILIESMNEGAVTLVKDGTILYCNQKFSEMVSTHQEKLIGQPFIKYLKKNETKKFEKLLEELQTNKKKDVFKLTNHDGSEKTVYISCHDLKFDTTEAISVVVTDISALQQAEERYATLMHNASCGIIVHDYRGVISEVNKQTEIILGRIETDIIGHDVRDFIPENKRKNADAVLEKIIENKTVPPIEGVLLRPDGERVYVMFSAAQIYVNGQELILAILNNVTERNRLQAQALLSDKLATIGTLASGIIHEINNPMTWVLSNLTYTKDELFKMKPLDQDQTKILAKLKEAIDDSIQGSDKIREIVLDLKGFIRVDSKKVVTVNLNDAIKIVVKMATAQFKNITSIVTDFDTHLPLLKLNESKMHQVLLNLIVNAAQAMDPAHSDKNKITLKTYKKPNAICIDISDTGKGMTPEVMAKIFQPFFTTKPTGVGAGLGLCLCMDIVHSLGGEISVQSVVNAGTTFTVQLPLNLVEGISP